MGASSCDEEATQADNEPTIAEKLSAIDGYASASEFQGKLDCLVATGSPGTETEETVADTLVAAWNASSKSDSLWDFTQAAASVYNC
jgi:hypothetical protein